MSLSQLAINQPISIMNNSINGELLEKVILLQDLSGLTPIEKVNYLNSVCLTTGLNPLTKPIQIMKFQGKEIPYFTKDATEQLRKINKVSITNLETKLHDGGLYVVTAHASTPDGRQDSSTGAIVIGGLKGDALANAMMKAETKAKRRVTLSICGLGFIDECEVDSIPGAKKVDVQVTELKPELIENNSEKLDEWLIKISQCSNKDELQTIYTEGYKFFAAARDKDSLNKIIIAKDKRKGEIEVKEFNVEIDNATGEVLS